MANGIEIVDMTLQHAYELARNLREDDRLECEALGLNPKESLKQNFLYSIMKKSILIDGKVAVAFGLWGTVLADMAHPWMLTSPDVEKVYLQLACAYRRQVKEMLTMFPRLENFCDSRYTKSLKLLRLVGFNVDAPEPHGKRGELFCKFWAEA